MKETLERIIAEHQFFHGMHKRNLHFITGCAKNVRFEAGQVIFREGDEAEQFYFVREGQIAVELVIPLRGSVRVQTVGEGDVLGWSWLVPPYHWHFGARTMQPTLALAFDGKCLRGKCEEDHDLGYELSKRFLHVVTKRLEATRLQLLDIYHVQA